MRFRAALVAVVDALVLVLDRPRPIALAGDLVRPHAWLVRVGTDGACAQLALAALWVVAAWLALGTLAAAATRLPGLGGRCAGVVARAVLPRTLRTVLAGSAGLGVLLAPIAAGATSPHASSGIAAQHHTLASLPAPSWPVDNPAKRPSPHPHDAPPSDARGAVTVRPGDSLWLIARRHLGPRAGNAQIAAAWPRWYAANRARLGDDPSLIRPGQVLHAPRAHGKEKP